MASTVTMSLARPMLRSPAFRQLAARRFESTAAQKATEAAKETTSKASQGLSRVTSAAGPAIAGAARGVGNTLGKLGGRTGKLIAFIERTSYHIISLFSPPLFRSFCLGSRRWREAGDVTLGGSVEAGYADI